MRSEPQPRGRRGLPAGSGGSQFPRGPRPPAKARWPPQAAGGRRKAASTQRRLFRRRKTWDSRGGGRDSRKRRLPRLRFREHPGAHQPPTACPLTVVPRCRGSRHREAGRQGRGREGGSGGQERGRRGSPRRPAHPRRARRVTGALWEPQEAGLGYSRSPRSGRGSEVSCAK